MDFLKAVAKFPQFCNEKADSYVEATLDEVCMIELTTIFAHMTQCSGEPYNSMSFNITEDDWLSGLVHIVDPICSN